MIIFGNGKPKEFLQLLKNFNKSIDGTGTTTVARRINFLCTLLCGEAIREFDNLVSHNNGTTNPHLKEIQEVLLDYFFPTNALIKKNIPMRQSTKKTCVLPMKILVVHITNLNNYLVSFPGSNNYKNMEEEDLNKIL